MKIRKSNRQNGLSTSFTFYTFCASTNDIIEKVGYPTDYHPENFEDRVTRQWELELSDGTYFTIYDWKEFRYYDDETIIEWHIGSNYNVCDKKKQDEKIVKAIEKLGFEMVKY